MNNISNFQLFSESYIDKRLRFETKKYPELTDIVSKFISRMSETYDLRFGEPFDRKKANCAWFTIEFYNWAKAKGLDVKVIYFDSDKQAHIAPMIDNKVIDFTIKQFTEKLEDDYLISNPDEYREYGYESFEIYDGLPKWLKTVFEADKIPKKTKVK